MWQLKVMIVIGWLENICSNSSKSYLETTPPKRKEKKNPKALKKLIKKLSFQLMREICDPPGKLK
jgi:hypothetical protein